MNVIGKFFIVFALLFVGGSTVQAASLYIDPAYSNIFRGDAIKMAVRLDVDEQVEECVNVVDAVITYSENISPVDISLGDSIFNVWVESPVINKDNRTITFAGGIPNGYCGRVPGDPRLTNTLVEIIFRSPGFVVGTASDDPTAIVQFGPESTAYLNDGFGTKAELATYGAQITLEDTAGPTLVDPWRTEVSEDNNPPKEFGINLQKDTRAFGGKYFIVFNTTDKETGIDHYEVMEEPLSELGAFQWGRADAPWVTTRSPYVLEDQSLNSTIYVKAIDKAGNEYIAKLIPNEADRGIPVSYFIIAIGGLLIALILVGIIVVGVRTYRKPKLLKNEAESTKSDEINNDE